MKTSPKRSASHWVFVSLGIITITVVCGWQLKLLFGDKQQLPIDFVAFWTAGHLNREGNNPYSPTGVRALQRSLGWDGTAIVTWNPPWLLTLVMPVGLLPIETASSVWLLVNLAVLMASVRLFWKGLNGPVRFWWVPQLIALTFTPTIFLLGSGQVTVFVLFGLAGFVFCTRANRPFLAGICVAVTAIKPHLLILLALWLLMGSLHSGFARRVVMGGVLMGLLASIPPTIANPHVWAQYRDAIQSPSSIDHHHFSDWKPPLVGWWLRQAVAGHPFVMQWCPLLLGLAGFAVFVLRGQLTQMCEEEERSNKLRICSFDIPDSSCHVNRSLPFVVGYSLLVAPYGVWPYDLVLLLIPVLAVATMIARSPTVRNVVAGLLLLESANAVSLIMLLAHCSSEWYVWMVPVILLGVFKLVHRTVSQAPESQQSAMIQITPVGA